MKHGLICFGSCCLLDSCPVIPDKDFLHFLQPVNLLHSVWENRCYISDPIQTCFKTNNNNLCLMFVYFFYKKSLN